MADVTQNVKKIRIVMFPWLAFGHMIPYLELAKLIAAKGHYVSFVSTARNINRLPKLPSNLSQCLNLVKLKLPVTEYDGNILYDAEATIDIPYEKVQYLKRAYDGLEQQMADFLEDEKPDWILHDFTAHWLSPIAKKLGIGCAYFTIFSSAMSCFTVPTLASLNVEDDRKTIEDFSVPPKWIPFDTKVAFRYFEVARIFDCVGGLNVSGITDIERASVSIKGCDLICIRGCSKFDGKWIQLLEKLHGKPVIPVGQLPTTLNDDEDESKTEEWLRIKAWLDQHDSASTIYVSFGSEAKPSQEEVTELAYGLEISGLPFFWVLRTRRGSWDEDVVKLPEGFEERVAGRGLVYTSWVPQLKILSHESIGGFLSHSGWSSVVEALQFAKALVLVTFLADQGINARVLEEKKIGYSVPRRENDGWFSRDSVAESLRLVMVEEEGKAFRDKAKEMSKLFGDRVLQDHYVNNLLSYLRSHKP